MKNPYRDSQVFCVTFAPDDTFQGFRSLGRITSYRKKMMDLLEVYDEQEVKYLLYSEISCPIGEMSSSANYQGPRWHCHGVMILKNERQIKRWLNRILPVLLYNGRVEVRTCLDIETWKDYCTKDQDISDILPFSNYEDAESFWDYCKLKIKNSEPVNE